MTSGGATAPAERRLRRDAAQNRDRLLAAARRVFDARGLDAGVAEVAQAAGVGMGTLYRHFPTKEALIDALVHDVLGATIRMAREAAEHPDGTGLERFLEAAGSYHAQHPGCLPRLWSTHRDEVRAARALIARLLADAQAAGRVREDLTGTDVTLTLLSLRGVLQATGVHAPEAWRRHLDLLIAGMRPTDEPLAHAPLSKARLDALLADPRRAGS